MKYFLTLMLLFSCSAQAEAGFSILYYMWKLHHPDTLLAATIDEWRCDPVTVSGPEIDSCGVGTGHDENEARANAFDAAKAEFQKIYDMDDIFHGHAVTVSPQRTECAQTGDLYKCKRQVNFLMQHELRDRPIVSGDKFDSFTFDTSKPVISKGMSKKDLLAKFGKPDAVRSNQGTQLFDYHGELCQIKSKSVLVSCTVFVEDGEVTGWDEHVDPSYTDALK